MGAAPLPNVPAGANIFIDANIFIYGLNGGSAECRQFLERCAREELSGFSLYVVVNEATHIFMLAEAYASGSTKNEKDVQTLRKNPAIIPSLATYWSRTQRILALNIALISLEHSVLVAAQPVRQAASLLTTDSMIISCMRQYGIHDLATRDADFLRVGSINVYSPTDV